MRWPSWLAWQDSRGAGVESSYGAVRKTEDGLAERRSCHSETTDTTVQIAGIDSSILVGFGQWG